MQKTSFRRAISSDWESVQTILWEAIDTSGGLYIADTNKEAVLSFIKEAEVYLIIEPKKSIGLIAYTMESPEIAHVEELVVRPEYKGKGYGTQAILWLDKKVKNIKKIVLETHPHNTPAICLYLNHDFRIEEWKDNFFGDGEPRIILTKVISHGG